MNFDGNICDKEEIDLTELILELSDDPNSGAITTFTGIVRKISDDSKKEVVGMEVESWTSKGKDSMKKIAKRLGEKHKLLGLRIVHITGELKIGDPIVYVVISSIHRKEAFGALEDIIHAYKNESPVWKKEIYSDGSEKWISTSDLASEETPNQSS